MFSLFTKQAGLLSAIPYAVMCAAVQIGGRLADQVRRRGLLTTTNTRKVFNFVGKYMRNDLVLHLC